MKRFALCLVLLVLAGSTEDLRASGGLLLVAAGIGLSIPREVLDA